MVVADKLGVTKFSPLAKAVPPVAAAYQLIVPELAEACKVTLPFPQREAGVVEVNTGKGFTVAKTALLVDVQLPLLAST